MDNTSQYSLRVSDGSFLHHISISDLLYYLVLIFSVAYFAVLPLRSTQVRHVIVLGGSIVFYLFAFYRLFRARYKHSELLRISIIIIELLGIIVFFPGEITETIYNCLNFFSLYVVLSTDNDIQMTYRKKKCSHLAFVLIAILLLITARSPVAYIFEDGKNSGALVLGMTNPNLTAMLIACVIGLLLIFLPDSRYKWVQIIIVAGLLYLIWKTEARGSILAVGIMVIYAFLVPKFKLRKWMIILPVVASVLFVPGYLSIFGRNATNAYRFLGKTLFSGRQFIYMRSLELLDNPIRLLFGNYDAMKFANAHNAPLTILCTLGVIGFINSYYSYTKQLISINGRATTDSAKIAIVMILCIYLLSSVESLMFTGVFPSISFMLFYVVLADDFQSSDE